MLLAIAVCVLLGMARAADDSGEYNAPEVKILTDANFEHDTQASTGSLAAASRCCA